MVLASSNGSERSERVTALKRRFHEFAGQDGKLSFAPGRVNLIGEHTDYSGGFVLPASLAIGTWTIAAARDDRMMRVLSENQREHSLFSLDVDRAEAQGHWSNYVAGVAWALQRSGLQLRGTDLLICSDVPMGSGLSSSAALEVSTAHALLSVAGLVAAPLEIARACHLAENLFVGAQCGIMDQFIATHGQPDRALLLDCADCSWRAVPLPSTHHWVVADTMIRHSHAHGEYSVRRRECEEVVKLMMHRLPHRERLADLTMIEAEQLASELSPLLARRLRHVFGENRRVLEAVRALESDDTDKLGLLLIASHESLRLDFEVSCPQLDLMVDLALQLPGVIGSRMIGGGFGGCTLSLVEAAHTQSMLTKLRSSYAHTIGVEPSVSVCEFGGAGGPVS